MEQYFWTTNGYGVNQSEQWDGKLGMKICKNGAIVMYANLPWDSATVMKALDPTRKLNVRGGAVIDTAYITKDLIVADSSGVNPRGGKWKLFRNLSGSTLYLGQIVEGDSVNGTDSIYRCVKKATSATLSAIGTVDQDSIKANAWGRIVTSGIGSMAVLNSTSATIRASGRVLTMSNTAGQGDCEATVSVVSHFKEVGHPISNKKHGINAAGDSLIYYTWHDL
jgi:hypothetical protein